MKIVLDAIHTLVDADLKKGRYDDLVAGDADGYKEAVTKVIQDSAYREIRKLFKNTVVVANADLGNSSFTLNLKTMDPHLREVTFETPIAWTAAGGELTSRFIDEGKFKIDIESVPELDAYLKKEEGQKLLANLIEQNYWVQDPTTSFVWLNAGSGEYQLHLKVRPEESRSQRHTFAIKGMVINEKEFHDTVSKLEFYRWADQTNAPLEVIQGLAGLKDQRTMQEWLAFNEGGNIENLSDAQRIKIEKY